MFVESFKLLSFFFHHILLEHVMDCVRSVSAGLESLSLSIFVHLIFIADDRKLFFVLLTLYVLSAVVF